MPTTSIGGLSSGLETASIIEQLMLLEATPQRKLKTNLSTEQSTLKVLQNLNARVAALATQAAALSDAGGWTSLKATSSHTGVTLSIPTGTATGSFSVTVNQTAAAHRLSFDQPAAATDVVVAGGTSVVLTTGGTSKTLDTVDGTLAGLAAALNASGTGVSATMVKRDDGSYRLLVEAGTTGAASTFTLTNADSSPLLGGATVQAGTDAAVTVGPDTLHSATNTFAGIIAGVDLTVSAAAVGSTAQVTVSRDASGVKDRVSALVAAVNATLTQIDQLTAYDPATKTAGPLAGDPVVRSLRSDLLASMYPLDGTSLAGVGVQTDRFGKLVLDEAAFAAAYTADPAGVAAQFTGGTVPGFAARVGAVSTSASDRYAGTLTAAVSGRTTQIDRIQEGITAWDRRLELRRNNLERQFTALETALNRMNSQSNWLTSQLGSLTSAQSK